MKSKLNVLIDWIPWLFIVSIVVLGLYMAGEMSIGEFLILASLPVYAFLSNIHLNQKIKSVEKEIELIRIKVNKLE